MQSTLHVVARGLVHVPQKIYPPEVGSIVAVVTNNYESVNGVLATCTVTKHSTLASNLSC